jgi:hypothetical protein
MLRLPCALLALSFAQANPLHQFMLKALQAPSGHALLPLNDEALSSRCLIEALPPNCDAMTESSRMRAAASLALCDLAQASLSIPAECKGVWHHGRCVEALARSPQHWSTYSGYLRDLLSVCGSLNQQRQLDLARSVYANASQAMLEILHLIKRAEVTRSERDEQDSEQRQQYTNQMQDVRVEMGRNLVVRAFGRDCETTNWLQFFDMLTNKLEKELEAYQTHAQGSTRAYDLILDRFKSAADEMDSLPARTAHAFHDQIASLLKSAVDKNDQALEVVVAKVSLVLEVESMLKQVF